MKLAICILNKFALHLAIATILKLSNVLYTVRLVMYSQFAVWNASNACKSHDSKQSCGNLPIDLAMATILKPVMPYKSFVHKSIL